MNTSRKIRKFRWIAAGTVAASCLTAAVVIAAPTESPESPSTRVVESVDLAGIAWWADANGLVGGSPAGLRQARAARAVESVDLAGIARWADANGLVGGSPAGLRQADD